MLASIDEKRQAAADELLALGAAGDDAAGEAGARLAETLDDLERALDDAWDRLES